MRTLILTVACLLTGGWRVVAQSLEVTGSGIALPDGGVLGAAFDDDHGRFFVQQTVLSTENHGLIIRSRRQLSSWDTKSHSMIALRTFDLSAPKASAYPCGRIAMSFQAQRLLACSAGTFLELIDPGTLSQVATFASGEDQQIYDFAVDDARGRVVVLSIGSSGAARLTAYSLFDGKPQHRVDLPWVEYPPFGNAGEMTVALAQESGIIGIANNLGNQADIYICTPNPTFRCVAVATTKEVSQITFLGNRLLVATRTASKRDCLLTVDAATRSVSRDYCAPGTGVHIAVGVVGGRYVAAFTGVSKYHILREETTSVSSSFSVWRAGNSGVAAVATDPTDYGAWQDQLMVVASATEPLFIAYQRLSNVLRLYSIVGHQ